MSFTMDTKEFLLLVMDIDKSYQDGRCAIFRDTSFWEKVSTRSSEFYERNCRSYWVSRFLYFPQLQDKRSRSFRFWARCYYAFMIFTLILFIYTMVYTLNRLLLFQKTMDLHLPLPAPHHVPHHLEEAAYDAPDLIRQGAQQVPLLRRIIPPVTCDVRDGSAFSTEYPCTCGAATCDVAQACYEATSSCESSNYLEVIWPCEKGEGIGPSRFKKEGYTESGAPYYTNGEAWLYHDPSCDGRSRSPRWIINDIKPDIDAPGDLDGDGKCNYIARADSDAKTGPPSGEWAVACDGSWQTMDMKIRMAHPPQRPQPALNSSAGE